MKFDAAVVGGGPGGLHCARILAESNANVLLLERNLSVGKKVCAGGITRGGLLRVLPESLLQRRFSSQLIRTRHQRATLHSEQTMLATVDRQELGAFMASEAARMGAEIVYGARLESIGDRNLIYRYQNKHYTATFDYLVGADGSHSKVRASLGLQSRRSRMGIGLNYRVPGHFDDMLWHFDPSVFRGGYCWIFPHRESTSVGAYIGCSAVSANELKKNLDRWMIDCGISRDRARCEADLVNHDYCGWHFGNTFLIGDAAGLASPLTGEGINPAVISGEAVARTIIDSSYKAVDLKRVIRRHRSHWQMVRLAGRSRVRSLLLSEICAFALQRSLISFEKFEMA